MPLSTDTDDLADLPLHRLAASIRAREVSPRELVAACLRRIERTDGQLHAFIELWADDALRAAQDAEREIAAGAWRGPLHGIPLALKDLVEVEGRRTTVGSAFWRERVSTHTATVAARLAEAGAVLLGKLHMVEFAFGGWGTNPQFGAPWNPWDLRHHRSPGGSSSGSGVAVAAGMATAAIGSDTGGSIRIPSSLNGLVGLKPTAASVSNHGVFPLSQTLDSIGPLARSVEDAGLVYDAIRGPDALDPATLFAPRRNPLALLRAPVAGLRLGLVDARQMPGTDPAALQAVRAAAAVLEGLGARVEEIALPRRPVDYCEGASRIIRTEGYANLRHVIETPDAPFGPAVRARVLAGKAESAAGYAATLVERRADSVQMMRALAGFDAILLPSTPIPAPELARIDEDNSPMSDLTRFANYLGLCALALPCGFSAEGMPLSLQIVGAPFEEARLLQLGWAYEQATDWHRRRPDLSPLLA